MKPSVYLDLENAGRVSEGVLEAMVPYFRQRGYGHTGMTHAPGWEAYSTFVKSGETIADALGLASADSLHFTYDTTGANNLALRGTVSASGKRGKILISSIEPLSVTHVADLLEKEGCEVVRIPVDRQGYVDVQHLSENLHRDTFLVSISWVNAEVGTIQPMERILSAIREKAPDALIHSDLSDAFGKLPVRPAEAGVDLATVSSTKLLGPPGIAGLYVRPGVKIRPLLEGSYSTQPLWPGDENIPALAGFAKAVEESFQHFENTVQYITALRDRMIRGLLQLPGTLLNGPEENRVCDNVNISFLDVEGEALTVELSDRGVYLSSGSACSRKILQPSHVLMAMGCCYEEAHGSLLMKLHRDVTEADVDHVLEQFPEAVRRLRSISGSHKEV